MNKTDVIIITAGAAIIFLLYIMLMDMLNSNLLASDGFAYWANAAKMAGADWSELAGRCAYFGYGYSFLLTPLFLIFQNTPYLFDSAIILNAGIAVSIFFVLCVITKRLLPKLKTVFITVICCALTLYAGNYASGQRPIADLLIVFLFLLILLLFMKLQEKPDFRLLIVVSALCVLSYASNQRALAIIVGAAITVLAMLITRRLTWKHFLVFAAVLAGLLYLSMLFKYNVIKQDSIVTASEDVNDYSQIFSTNIPKLFTAEGVRGFFSSIAGQLYYLGTSSFSVVIWGIIISVYYAGKFLINLIKIKCRDKNTGDNVSKTAVNDDSFFTVSMLLAVTLITTLIIAGIKLLTPERIDHVINGRYIQYLASPMMLLVISVLLKGKLVLKDKVRKLWITEGIIVSFMLLSAIYLEWYTTSLWLPDRMDYMNMPGIGLFAANGISFLQIAMLTGGISVLLFALFLYKTKALNVILTVSIAASVFSVVSVHNILNKMYWSKSAAETSLISVARKLTSGDDISVSYVVLPEYIEQRNGYAECIQFYAPQESVKLVSADKLQEWIDMARIDTKVLHCLVLEEATIQELPPDAYAALKLYYQDGAILVYCPQ